MGGGEYLNIDRYNYSYMFNGKECSPPRTLI